jgi:hypothetical protein
MRQAAETARCDGIPRGRCRRPVVAFVVALDEPGVGLHVRAPLSLTATCRRHRRKVLSIARRDAVPWVGLKLVKPTDVPAVLRWFHSDAGLCAGGRGIRVGHPGDDPW